MASMSHPPPLSPQLLKSFTQEVYGSGASLAGVNYLSGMNNMNLMGMGMGLPNMQMPGMGSSGLGGLKPSSFQAMSARSMQGTVAAGVAKQQRRKENKPPETQTQTQTPTTAPSTTTSAASAATQTTTQTADTAHTEQSKTQDASSADKAADTTTTNAPHMTSLGDGFASSSASPSADPRYIAMASRIAAYYHQRCQAVANFQQQRCQAWANMQRQKSQEMSQAAMLVVAWYIRDRIQRRRRRQKRHFRRGLSRSTATPATARITKGEAVRKWVLQVPENAAANENGQKPSDPSEVSFDMDRDTKSDKDARLYNVADNLIKSQLARVDVPMLGALSFSSDTESESENGDDEDEDEKEDKDKEDDDNAYEVAYEETPARAGLGAKAAFTVPADTRAKAEINAEDYVDDESTSCSEDSDEYEDEDCCMESSEVVHHGTAKTRPASSF